MAIYVKDEPGALAFPSVMGGPIHQCNFNRMSAWPQAVQAIGMPGLHFHDLRHHGKPVRPTAAPGSATSWRAWATTANEPR